VIDIEEVLVAKIVSALQSVFSFSKTFFFSSKSSKTASMTRSASAKSSSETDS